MHDSDGLEEEVWYHQIPPIFEEPISDDFPGSGGEVAPYEEPSVQVVVDRGGPVVAAPDDAVPGTAAHAAEAVPPDEHEQPGGTWREPLRGAHPAGAETAAHRYAPVGESEAWVDPDFAGGAGPGDPVAPPPVDVAAPPPADEPLAAPSAPEDSFESEAPREPAIQFESGTSPEPAMQFESGTPREPAMQFEPEAPPEPAIQFEPEAPPEPAIQFESGAPPEPAPEWSFEPEPPPAAAPPVPQRPFVHDSGASPALDPPMIIPIRAYYLTRADDTLRSIAAQFLNTPSRWQELRSLNAAYPGVAIAGPDTLLPIGSSLALPGDPLPWGKPDPVYLWTLAEKFLYTAWGREPTPEEVVPFWRGLTSGAKHLDMGPSAPAAIGALAEPPVPPAMQPPVAPPPAPVPAATPPAAPEPAAPVAPPIAGAPAAPPAETWPEAPPPGEPAQTYAPEAPTAAPRAADRTEPAEAYLQRSEPEASPAPPTTPHHESAAPEPSAHEAHAVPPHWPQAQQPPAPADAPAAGYRTPAHEAPPPEPPRYTPPPGYEPVAGMPDLGPIEPQAPPRPETEAPPLPAFMPSLTGATPSAELPVEHVVASTRGVLAGTAIGDAMILWQLGKLRRRRGAHPGATAPDPLELSLEQTARTDSLRLIEAAMRHLRAVTVAQLRPKPRVVCVRTGTYGFEVLLDQPVEAPEGWQAASGGYVLELPRSVTVERLDAVGQGPSLCPALVPVGDTNEGPMLLNIEEIGCLAVSGSNNPAASLLTSIVETLGSSPLAGDIRVVTVGISAPTGPGWERIHATSFDSPQLEHLLTTALSPAHAGGGGSVDVLVVGPGNDLLFQRAGQIATTPGSRLVLVGATSSAAARWPWRIHLDEHARAVVHPIAVNINATQAMRPELAYLLSEAAGGPHPPSRF